MTDGVTEVAAAKLGLKIDPSLPSSRKTIWTQGSLPISSASRVTKSGILLQESRGQMFQPMTGK